MVGELLPYALLFARMAVGLLFALSAMGKLRDLPAFAQAMAGFRLLPRQFTPAAAALFVTGEAAVVLLMLAGGRFLVVGFGLALSLLAHFSAVIAAALARGLQTPCHCFGASQRAVSGYELWRNLGFTAVALLGLGALASVSGETASLNLAEFSLVGLMAAACVILWARLEEIIELLRTA
jgi:hypothetical protein